MATTFKNQARMTIPHFWCNTRISFAQVTNLKSTAVVIPHHISQLQTNTNCDDPLYLHTFSFHLNARFAFLPNEIATVLKLISDILSCGKSPAGGSVAAAVRGCLALRLMLVAPCNVRISLDRRRRRNGRAAVEPEWLRNCLHNPGPQSRGAITQASAERCSSAHCTAQMRYPHTGRTSYESQSSSQK